MDEDSEEDDALETQRFGKVVGVYAQKEEEVIKALKKTKQRRATTFDRNKRKKTPRKKGRRKKQNPHLILNQVNAFIS